MFLNCTQAEKFFNAAWDNVAYTQITLDDLEVNTALTHYELDRPVSFTRRMLWDMETKKSWNPKRYIPYVVQEGHSFGDSPFDPSKEGIFTRSSQQKQWLHPESYDTVYEEVYVNHQDQRITFIGTTVLEGMPPLHPLQPLFHVQHAVGGSEDAPTNKWRIVFLTERKDEDFIMHFHAFNNPKILPGFIVEYIKNDLGVNLHARTDD